MNVSETCKYVLVSLVLGTFAAMPAHGQDGRPRPEPATPATPATPGAEPVVELGQPVDADAGVVPGPPAEIAAGAAGDRAPIVLANGRRPDRGDRVVLAFDDVSVKDTIPFIVETTGKVVMPVNITTLKAKKITLINDEPIDRMTALDLLVEAFRLNDVGVIEHDNRIIIALLSEMPRFPTPVIGPDEDIFDRIDRGTIVTKIFAVRETDAESLAEQLRDPLPDHPTNKVDMNSNQIIAPAHTGLSHRPPRPTQHPARPPAPVHPHPLPLAYADANEIAQNILDLFEDTGTARTGTATQRTSQASRQRRATQRGARTPQRATGAGTTGPGPTAELRITVNVQQNAVTVSGEPEVINDIAGLIAEEWDLPRPETTKQVYHLRYTDPLKLRDLLAELLGGGGAGGAGGAVRRGRGAGAAGGQRADVSQAIGGIYQIEAYPDSNSLVVLCKTVESFTFLDSLIEDLDQPVFPGGLIVIELKHADAEEVADQINAIFARAGARVDLQRRTTGLAGVDIGDGEGGGGPAREGTDGGTITFPWQQGRQDENETPASPLIGKVRVVPIHRQNAVMILAAPEYREAVHDIIVNQLDKPGRQVLISAIIAEIELTDDLAFGLRLSSSPIPSGGTIDNRVGAGFGFTGMASNFFGSVFNTTTLDANMSINVVLQALAEKTKVRILQEPMVFTADNQEASFFEGKDVPIVVNTQDTLQGGFNETIEYRAVGIGLNVRPRITSSGDVDMEINLEISNLDPVESALGPVFDRRETTTQVIVKDGQTIVISGILRDEETRITRKFPLLGDLPLIGGLFTSIDKQQTRTELIAFITPYIVDNPDENDDNFNKEARQRLLEISKPLDDQVVTPIDPDKVKSRLLMERYKKYTERASRPPRPGRGGE